MYFLLEQCLFEYKIELFVSQIFLVSFVHEQVKEGSFKRRCRKQTMKRVFLFSTSATTI